MIYIIVNAGSKKVLIHGDSLSFCPKCNGTGFLDWIENILGKKKKKKSFTIKWDTKHLQGEVVYKEVVELMSEEIKISIDEEILKKLLELKK